MSDSEATPTVRRSQRERKPAKPFTQESTISSRKRKRDVEEEEANITDHASNDGEEKEDEPEENEDEDGDDEDEEMDAYRAPKRKVGRPKKQKEAGEKEKPKPKTPTAKKPRAPRAKAMGVTRKTKGDASTDITKLIKDNHISDDNALFNSVLNPSAALQSTVEEFLDSLSTTPELALADLINCILRACGCNESVDSDQAADLDGIVDALDTLTENLKQENAPLYPLASRLPVFKKFHKHLSEFFTRLVASSAELGTLYSSDLLPLTLSWVVAMSSSQLRSLRHTATVIAMDLESALCDVAASVEQEVITIARQREGEKKRAGKTKGKTRDKDFENKAEEVREREKKLAEYLDDFFNGVFIHRYRDHDPGIRAECVQAMGSWLKSHPSKFLDTGYLRYIGWILSDADAHVRLAAVKSLQALYASGDHIGALQSFTDRFKTRLVQMATSDLELSVRVATLQVLRDIDGHALLEEEQRDQLCLLVYDEEARVRRAVSGFVKGIWEEAVEERMLGRVPEDKEKDTERVGIKCLAELLVKWGKRTRQGPRLSTGQTQDDEGEEEEGVAEDSKNRDIARLVSAQQKGRIALVVEALWEEVPIVNDWEALLEHLLLDHSASDVNGVHHPSPRRAGKKPVDEELVDEAYRLSESEEAALLELFVAALRRIREEATSPAVKKGEGENIISDMTRALIKGVPRLFAKHQTDSNRVADVLTIPQLMNLELYLDMRMIPAYEGLWDDVIKQFTSHSSPITLSHATATIQHLASVTILANANTTKMLELEEELSTSLRDVVAGREELEIAGFSEDEVHKLGAIAARLVMLSSMRDISSWMEEDEGGKQSSAWDIMNALADRGRLGYKEEEIMIEEILRLLTLHLAWKARRLSTDPSPSEEAIKYSETLEEQRNTVLEKITEFAVGSDSKPAECVRRAAFHNLLDIHILFYGTHETLASALPLSMDDETQYRCAGYIQAEIEQFVDDIGTEKGETTDEESSQAGTETEKDDDDKDVDDDAGKTTKGKRGRRKARREDTPDPHTLPRSRLEREYILNALLAAFIRAIRVGVLNPSHSAVVLAHYGHLGSGFDATIKVVIDFLRDIGMFQGEGKTVSEILVRTLQESFEMSLDGSRDSNEHTVALARALTSCFVIRGAQLSVIKRLDGEHVVVVHLNSISWIVKKLAAYEATQNKKMIRRALHFFRALQQMLSTVESRDALKIKAHLDQAMAQAKLQPEAVKIWDPYRSYEKRLFTSMSRDKNIPNPKTKSKRGRKPGKSADMVSSDDDEAEVENIVEAPSGTEGEGEEQPAPAPKPKAKPRPKPRAKARKPQENADDENNGDVFGPVSVPKPTRSPSKRQAAQKPPIREVGSQPPEEEEIPAVPAVNGHKSPENPSQRKRPREEVDSELSEPEEPEDPTSPAREPSPARSHVSVADVKNRRKRIRR
ncbi:hypothetical protein M422DRAFT_61048 [Sphaerobolus stellatus SS14]|uniref:SCD domain-containing protein n=1 Tax=Sphaerobolus stellatus (strain SS14) TaxID=990650 RepID=A0A0C9VIE1_SPHS4|nr:hypothetical protein M422DRAFT_61048 [Sphaerobolus stellatus SS14]